MSAHNRNIAVIRNFIERQNKNSVGEWASIFTDRKRCDKVEIETNWNLWKTKRENYYMTIEEMFGDLYSIDIMAEKKTGEIVLFLICYGFIDGEEKTQRALLTKIEAYFKYTKSAKFQNEYLKCPIILRVTFKEKPDQLILDLLKNSQSWIMEYDVTLEVEINNKTIKLLP